MLDLAAGIKDRNHGLRKPANPRALLECLKIVLPLVVIAGALSFHIWIRGQNIHIGSRIQQLNAQEKDSLRVQQQLILEEQTLKDPELLEAIARRDGMILLRPDQIVPPSLEDLEAGSSEILALGNLSLRSSEPKKPFALN